MKIRHDTQKLLIIDVDLTYVGHFVYCGDEGTSTVVSVRPIVMVRLVNVQRAHAHTPLLW